ncbi:prephenate dehydratase [Nakamurella lactea]|uniref:prephenate dehydratase n=1 Tax=Nakamurella lactea TaxID=459515 RepID=UPI0004225305|nr:prephenate dehydratase [Nakamurella lactea]
MNEPGWTRTGRSGATDRGDERWAYLGPEGTFTEQAARDLAGRTGAAAAAGHPELVPVVSVSEAMAQVRSGAAAAAIAPLENSVEGSVSLTQDELIHGGELRIVAEAFVAVRFDLLVRPGTTAEQIATVGSHPHGLAQVRDYLAQSFPQARSVVTSSTAGAAAAVQAGELDAAAAAPVAGERYGLESLASDIGLNSAAVTRFVLVRRPARLPSPTGNDRTSLVLGVPNRPGTLLEVLGEIARRGINLTRLESRPTRETMGEYLFLVDADGHLAEPAMADTLSALHRRGALHRFLGSYPRGQGQNVPLPAFATDAAYTAAGGFIDRLGRADGSVTPEAREENPCDSS